MNFDLADSESFVDGVCYNFVNNKPKNTSTQGHSRLSTMLFYKPHVSCFPISVALHNDVQVHRLPCTVSEILPLVWRKLTVVDLKLSSVGYES